MKGIPVRIVTQEEMEYLLRKKCGKSENIFSYAVIGCKKTGKVVAKFKINNKTGEKILIYKDKKDKLIQKLEQERKL